MVKFQVSILLSHVCPKRRFRGLEFKHPTIRIHMRDCLKGCCRSARGKSPNCSGMRYLRADAVPPTPKKRGRRRLTALEVLQAKSAFCRSQRIFLRLACSWERFEGSAEATKGAPVPFMGGLTVLRIPSKKGKARMLLGLGTRVGWSGVGGGGGWC